MRLLAQTVLLFAVLLTSAASFAIEPPPKRIEGADFSAVLGEDFSEELYDGTPLSYNEWESTRRIFNIPIFKSGTPLQEVLAGLREKRIRLISYSDTHITVVNPVATHNLSSALDYHTFVYGFENDGLVFGPLDTSDYFGRLNNYGYNPMRMALLRLYVEENTASAETFNNIAWRMSVSNNEKARNPELAVQLAIEASRLTNYASSDYLDTLAAALAADGNYPEAVKYQQRSIDIRTHPDKDFEFRLNLYKKQRSFQTTVNNPENVPEYLAQPSLEGDAEAMHGLAAYCRNNEIAAFGKTALEWLEQSADLGYAEAQTDLGKAYMLGRYDLGVDDSAAWLWLQQAHNNGSAEGSQLLALLYGNAGSAYHDDEKATQTMAVAIDRGAEYLLYELAARYQHGIGVPADPQKARELIARFESEEHLLTEFLMHEPMLGNSAIRYHLMELEDKDKKVAPFAFVEELEKLGNNYLDVEPNPEDEWDYDEASWFDKDFTRLKSDQAKINGFHIIHIAARLGHAPAQRRLGTLYDKGMGTRISRKAAQYWADRAAQNPKPPKLDNYR